MRSRGLQLGSIGGVPLILTPGWGIISIVLVVLFTPTVQTLLGLDLVPAALVAAGVPLLLALSVLLHELAHGLTAQRLGVRVREYVLSLWGGHTAFHSEISRPGASALVAVLGPLTNGVLAVVFWAAAGAVDARAAALVLGAAAYTNAFVAVFNALPALPMDGGRALEALVWKVRDDRDLGTLVAARTGQVVAVLVALGALWRAFASGRQDWVTLVWGLLIASMLWQGASGAAKVARARRATRGVDLRQWARPVTLLAMSAPVSALATATPPVLLAGPNGLPVAQVMPEAVASVPEAARPTTPLAAVATRLPAEAVLLRQSGTESVAQLARAARAGARVAVLIGPDRQVLGVVDIAEVGKHLPR